MHRIGNRVALLVQGHHHLGRHQLLLVPSQQTLVSCLVIATASVGVVVLLAAEQGGVILGCDDALHHELVLNVVVVVAGERTSVSSVRVAVVVALRLVIGVGSCLVTLREEAVGDGLGGGRLDGGGAWVVRSCVCGLAAAL